MGKAKQGSGRSFRRQAETEQSGLCDAAGRIEGELKQKLLELRN